jgi:hypothetical protein
MVTEKKEYVLYILMRKDMLSLNHAGKMVAQGAHAANHCASMISSSKFGPEIMAQFHAWENSTQQGFGTTIVLGTISDRAPSGKQLLSRPLKISDIQSIIETALVGGFAAGITHDPSYPLQDGATMHQFPCDTCGWIFGTKKDLAGLLKSIDLHGASAGSEGEANA